MCRPFRGVGRIYDALSRRVTPSSAEQKRRLRPASEPRTLRGPTDILGQWRPDEFLRPIFYRLTALPPYRLTVVPPIFPRTHFNRRATGGALVRFFFLVIVFGLVGWTMARTIRDRARGSPALRRQLLVRACIALVLALVVTTILGALLARPPVDGPPKPPAL
jgi:hypothetical protein